MTDTLELLKTKLASDIGGRQSYCNNVRNAVLACALRKMSCGALRAYYGEEGDAWDAIERCVTKEAMEEVLGDKYRSAMRYGTDPAEAVRISRIVSDVEDYFGTKLDRYAIGLFSERKVACSCGTECVFLPGSDPGNQRGEDIWLCPSCGASVGCHSGTNIPLGIPASGETSVLRVRIHEEIDRLVQSGLSRGGIYRELSRKMALPPEKTHAGMFGLRQCEEALGILKSMKGGYRL